MSVDVINSNTRRWDSPEHLNCAGSRAKILGGIGVKIGIQLFITAVGAFYADKKIVMWVIF